MEQQVDAHRHITVVMPTCNRPHDVQRCLDSLYAVEHPSWNLLVVDQSDDEATEAVVRRFQEYMPHLAYHHMDQKGLARARNRALRLATVNLIAFIDDDCTVERDWLSSVAAAFERWPAAAAIFGAVRPGPYDERVEAIPTYTIARERVIHDLVDGFSCWGMGASMYVRRTAALQVYGFDVYTGSGSLFSGEDKDFRYRLVVSGRQVVETPSIVVTHFGRRTHAEFHQLTLLWAFSNAGLYIKMIRRGYKAAWLLLLWEAMEYGPKINLVNLLVLRKPTGLAWIAYYLRGVWVAQGLPLNRRRLLWGRSDDYR